MSARILEFPSKAERQGVSVVTMFKHALIVAAVIGGVVLVDNMTGRKLSMALAA